MCIAIYSSKAPLQIQFIQEQIWCNFEMGEQEVEEVYDIVFTNQGSESIRNIVLLSPHLLFNPVTVSPEDIPSIELPKVKADDKFNWYMKEEPDEPPSFGEDSVYFSTAVYDRVGVEANYYRYLATPVSGDAKFHGILRTHKDCWESFLGLNHTITEISFTKDVLPDKTIHTPYFVRIILKPLVLNHRVGAKQLDTGEGEKKVLIQPSEILAPKLVFGQLRAALWEKVNIKKPDKADQRLWKELVEDGFDNPKNISWIQDHRMSVVTDQRCLVLDTQRVGAVAFVMASNAGSEEVDARIWNAGGEHFPKEDPFYIGRRICKYFCEHANNEDRAKTILDVSHETGLPFAHTFFVIKALQKKELLFVNGEDKYYCKWIDKELFSKDNQVPLRAMISEPQDGPEGTIIRFPGKSFLVQFDLLWIQSALSIAGN